MNSLVKSTEQLVNTLSRRERMIVLIGILSVLYMIWDTLLIVPLQESQKKVAAENLTIQQQLSDLEVRNILATGMLQNKNNEKFNKDIARVKGKISDLDQVIKQRLQDRVPAELMASLLNDLLQKNQRLELQYIHNLPAESLVKDDDAEKSNSDKQAKKMHKNVNALGIFVHPLEIELHGSYLDILDYLILLEDMQWKIYWDQVKLNVIEYPQVKVRIKVHTFSLKEGWLSV